MPKRSQMEKWRSYPGEGQMKATPSWRPHGSCPAKPCVMPRATVSCMRVSEELPPTTVCSGAAPTRLPIRRRASGKPARPP